MTRFLSQVAALALLLALVGGAALAAWKAHQAVRLDQLARETRLKAEYAAGLAAAQALPGLEAERERLAARASERSGFAPGESEAAAQAWLQQALERAFAAAGGQVAASRALALAPREDGGALRIALEATAQEEYPALVAGVLAVEALETVVLIERAEIRRGPGAPVDGGVLSARLTAAAFVKGGE